MNNSQTNAVCCTSGGYKNVFAQGVLKAFNDNSFQAGVYASCSSSALVSAFAACRQINELDISLWEEGYEISQREGNQSQAMLSSIDKLYQTLNDNLWLPSSSRFLVAVSKVKTKEAAEITQTEKAKRYGQKLLIEALRHRTDWRDQHLEARLFDSILDPKTELMNNQNLKDVLYATTRMLHAWNIPASINNEAYIDGSYTASCLIFPVMQLGYKKIIFINTEHDKIFKDLFTEIQIPSEIENANIHIIQPDCNLAELGVDFYSIKENGLQQVFSHGYEKGNTYLKNQAI